MKKQFKTLIALMLALVFVFAFASCAVAGSSDNGAAGDGAVEGAFDVALLASSNTEGVPEEDEFDDSDDFRIRFVYSYTAKVVNSNGRTEYKKEVKTVASIYVPVDNTGFTDEHIAKFNSLTYNGYSFATWYTQWNTETQTGVTGTEFTPPTTAITSDMTVYGDRGNLAGATSTWELGTVGEDGNFVSISADALEEATDVAVKISGTGAMFDYKNANEIDVPWYKYANKITKVIIGEGITVIGTNSFNGLTRMKSIDFGEKPTVQKINDLAFNGCTSNSFKSLKTPSSLTYIGADAFGYTKLTEVVLNDGLVELASRAFYSANSIKSIVVPASLKKVGDGAFHPGANGSSTKTHQLARVYYKGTPEQFYGAEATEETEAVEGISIGLDNTWFKDQPTIYYFTNDESVGKNINAEYSYWHYEEINGEDVPVQYCYTIRYYAGSDAITPIASLRVPVEVQYTYNEVGEKVVAVNDSGALVLAGVVDYTILDKQAEITNYGHKFDWSNNGLTLGQVLKDDTKITCTRGDIVSDYGGITKKTESVTEGTTSKTTMRVALDPEVENRIRKDVASLVARGVITETVVDGVTKTVAEQAEALIAERLASAYKIWDFANALAIKSSSDSNVTELVIEDGVTYIGSFAFAGLSSLTSVVIPDSVVGISSTAFNGCSNLAAIYYDSNDVSKCVGIDKLQGVSATVYAKAYAPTAAAGKYWMDFSVDAEAEVKKIAWSLDSEGTLVIGGDSEMVDLPHASYAPWSDAKDSITAVAFANNITSVGENIINGYSKVTSISLPNSVKAIPESAFAGTALVNNRTAYPNGLLIVSGHLIKVDAARKNTTLFETVHGIINIAEGAFEGCDKIERLFITATLLYINEGAFPVSNIKEVYVDGQPASWANISKDADFGDVAAYFRADTKPANLDDGNKYYVKTGNEYAIWGCNCVYGKWIRTTDPTCMTEGEDTRYCIYDERHTQTRVVDIDPDAHAFAEQHKANKDANCVSGGTKARFCTIAGCKEYTDEIDDETKVKWSHYYVATYALESDGSYTCTLTCSRNCSDPETYGEASVDGIVVYENLTWNKTADATDTTAEMGYFTSSDSSVSDDKYLGSAAAPIAKPSTDAE